MLPEDLAGERRESVGGVTDEAAHSVRVHAQKEGDEQVVSVPERLERLLSNSVVSSRVHQQHAEKHHVAGNSTGLGVVDLKRQHGSDLRPLNVEKAAPLLVIVRPIGKRAIKCLLDVVSSNVANSEEQHGVGDLTMEPQILIQWEEPELRAQEPDQRPTYWQEDEECVE